jgi:pimeloyl-ACP methyl ester carboxylesterase
VVCAASLAPFGVEGLDWFAGMVASGEAELRAAIAGRATLEDFLASSEFDTEMFTPADHAVLGGAWAWLGVVAMKGLEGGVGGMVDDDLAFVSPWGFHPAQVRAPTLILQGGQDRIVPNSHGQWLAQHCPSAELWLRPDDGHISVLNSGPEALGWLRVRSDIAS